MKRIILLATVLLSFSFGIYAQIVNIPDANVKDYLAGYVAINTNSDTEIQVNEASTFSGIEAFINLEKTIV